MNSKGNKYNKEFWCFVSKNFLILVIEIFGFLMFRKDIWKVVYEEDKVCKEKK